MNQLFDIVEDGLTVDVQIDPMSATYLAFAILAAMTLTLLIYEKVIK